ncbi:MAG: ABC transporter permease [Thaumarchaeota archaeon]|nr:ABC transporter permease [Candidatus Calditenuaceae archaeon]MDW8186972.1 ABC transporter permease [Nitrososphaerota archaeon]
MTFRFPALRIERRLEVPPHVSAAVTVLFLSLSFVISGSILQVMGVDAVAAISQVASVYTSPQLLVAVVLRGIPIGLAAVGLSIAFRAGFWNIGAEGQMYMGMFASTGVVLLHVYYGLIPGWALLPVMAMAAFVAGGLYCSLAGLLKAKLGVNEVLTTLMMNFIAILFVDYLVYGPWRDPRGFGFPLTVPFPAEAKFGGILGDAAWEGLALLGAVALLAYFLMTRTTVGLDLKLIGDNPQIAGIAGVRMVRTHLILSMITGGLAGLAGFFLLTGIVGRLRPRISPGYGYTAIVISFLAGLHPVLAVPAAVFMGGLIVGGDVLQSTLNLPFAAVQLFQSTILIMIVVGEFVKRYRVVIG